MAAPRTSQDRKLDELIRLSRERDQQLASLSAQVAALSRQVSDQSEQIAEMSPTVKQVADAVTFAKVGRTVFRFLMGIGIAATPVLWWMSDRWHLLGQFFKRTP